MFERYTDRSRRVIVLAQEQVRLLKHDHIGTEHLLLALVQEDDSVAAKVLKRYVSVESLTALLEPGETTPSGHVPFTARCKRVLELGLRESLQLGMNYIAPEHLLLGIIREPESHAARLLTQSGADLNDIRGGVIEVLVKALEARPPRAEVAKVVGEIIGADFDERDDHRIVLHVAVPETYRVRRCNVVIGEKP